MSQVIWQPQPGPQTLFLQAQKAFEVGYGGALGGGKTDALLGNFAAGLKYGSGWKGIFIRKHFPDMDDVIMRSMEIFGPIFGERCFNQSRTQWKFPNGSMLQFRALEQDNDVYKYIGQQYTCVMWDQLEQWASPFAYTYLMTRIRSAKGVPCQVRAAFNPGGEGHAWVQARFVDPMPPGTPLKVETRSINKKTGKQDYYWRIFIPAKLEDNKILMDNDPSYGDRIYEVYDQAMAEALREGRWDKISGAMFMEFDPNIHVIDYSPIPPDKMPLRAMDWGYTEPYCCLHGFQYDGDIIIGNELYGWGGLPNKGSEEPPEVVRAKIHHYESANGLYVPFGLLDPQCWERTGTGNLIEMLSGGHDDPDRMHWKPWPKGPGSRVSQCQAIHQLMAVVNGKSRLKIMRNCRHLIRTLPILPRDKHNPEDINTNAEDHPYDTLRGLTSGRLPTRDQLRRRAQRKRLAMTGGRYVTAQDLDGGNF